MMKRTEQTLLEQMRITEFEIDSRKELFSITLDDEAALKNAKQHIEKNLDRLVDRFYEMQTAVPEIALLIGDSETLGRLRNAQKRYLLDLFSGYYDIEYVNDRLRIGMVHKRIGVEPKLYLAAVQTLMSLLSELIRDSIPDPDELSRVNEAIHKLMAFDISLVFDTYIRSLISEIETSKIKSERYASALEEKVRERTIQLETLSRTDPLTGLLNMRHMSELLTIALRTAQRRSEPVTVVYIDINDFKIINDTQGHQNGDDVLKSIATILKDSLRSEDLCFRYGGDEFCIVMPNCNIDNAIDVWEKRMHELTQQYENIPGLSIGYAQTGPDQYISAEELIRLADEKMYEYKKVLKQA